jgi:hypothetical protein
VAVKMGFLALREQYRLKVPENVVLRWIFDPSRDFIKGIYVMRSFMILLEK